jgi:WD40 repeat protein
LPVITAVAMSPDGQRMAVSGYHEVFLLDVAAAIAGRVERIARLVGMSERIESIQFAPDGQRLAVAGGSPGRLGEVQVWDAASHQLILSHPVGYDTCYGISWSGDGKQLAFGCPDHSIRAIDASTGEQVFFNAAHNDWVLDTVFSQDNKHVVSVSRDRSMKLYEFQSKRFIDNITSITPGALKGGLHSVDRHPQRDELLIGGADGVAKVYRMFREKNRQIGDDYNLVRAYGQMPGRIYSASFSADGEWIVAGSSDRGKGHVHVFKTEDGSVRSQANDIAGGVYAVALTSDAAYFLAGGFDGKLYVGNAADGTITAQLVAPPMGDQVTSR